VVAVQLLLSAAESILDAPSRPDIPTQAIYARTPSFYNAPFGKLKLAL